MAVKTSRHNLPLFWLFMPNRARHNIQRSIRELIRKREQILKCDAFLFIWRLKLKL